MILTRSLIKYLPNSLRPCFTRVLVVFLEAMTKYLTKNTSMKAGFGSDFNLHSDCFQKYFISVYSLNKRGRFVVTFLCAYILYLDHMPLPVPCYYSPSLVFLSPSLNSDFSYLIHSMGYISPQQVKIVECS